MNLKKRLLTKNACYIAGGKINPQGLMIHSTGANNPRVARYVDAPELDNVSSNHWNQNKPDGQFKCVHGFIGLLNGSEVGTYQTLPWDHRAWGGGGSSNDTHIHIEICEDNLKDASYFAKVYKEAVEVAAMLCEKYGFNPLNKRELVTHSEGHQMGIASNHADVMHWFPKHGKSMDTFRKDVHALMGGDDIKFEQPISPSKPVVGKSILDLAQEVLAGKHGSGEDRKKSLGASYDAVQAKVNELANAKEEVKPAKKSITQLAQEVIDGKHGSGDARQQALGSDYAAVQAKVNELLGASNKPKPVVKSVDQLAQEVIDGKHGSGDARRKALGGRYDEVQTRVNQIVGGKAKPKPQAKSLNTLVEETLRGEHGSGRERMVSLGARYAEVQREVNKRLR